MKAWLRGIVAALAAAVASEARAGLFHGGAGLICSDCHTMHEGVAPNLMKKPDVTELCLSCHEGSPDAPDVLAENTGTHVRLAGALSAVASAFNSVSTNLPYEHTRGHTLGATAVPPGSNDGIAITLTCTSCHLVHGAPSAYRNLAGVDAGGQLTQMGGEYVTFSVGTNDVATDVFQRTYARGAFPTTYGIDAVDLNATARLAGGSMMTRFCEACHPAIHSDPGSVPPGGAYRKHPTAGVHVGEGATSLARFAALPNRVKVTSATGWGTPGAAWPEAPADLGITCTTCHKAHGNQNPFGLVYLSGTGTVTEEGDASGVALGAQTLCQQCHTKGFPAAP